MKFSEQWLREWVNPDVSTDELVAMLTMAGLEVDGYEPVAAGFNNVVIGEVLEVEPHPDADRLRVCQVKVAEGDVRQIVCGAPNVEVGMLAPLAQVGAVFEDGMKINKAKLRKVESLGMLCSAKELGLAESSDGLFAFPKDASAGTDVRQYLGLDDQAIDVDLTPNRGDCLSIAGVAREVGVFTRSDVKQLDVDTVDPTIDDLVSIKVSAPEDCPRYQGRVIRGINAAAITPLWMQEKLRRSGIRSLGALVDITNYVLLELGQPMHAFDLEKLSGDIDVRRAVNDEKLVMLDGKETTLKDDTLVIADANGPLAMAGIMGGEASGCGDDTTAILLECAYFNPLVIAGRARNYGMHTDSSHRFERGVDPQLQQRAMDRATGLILEIAGGQAGPVNEAVSEAHLPKPAEIELRPERIKRLLGIEMAGEEVEEIFTRLGMGVTRTDAGWMIKAPSYRFDMAIEADLIEELARIYGYDNIPSEMPSGHMLMPEVPENQVTVARLRNVLVDRGYQEAITYSFVDPKQHAMVDPVNAAIALANPISSDLSVMRTTLWTGLLAALVHNQKRQQSRIRLFETGLAFLNKEEGIDQRPRMAGVIIGDANSESWGAEPRRVDFFDLKADVEALMSQLGDANQIRFDRAEHPALHPGQSAKILRDDKDIGWIGAVHPSLAADMGIKGNAFMFEIALEAIIERKPIAFTPLSKFPSIRRDLAVIVDADVSVKAITDTVNAAASKWLTDLIVFDIYSGQGVETGRKSVALGLILQDSSRTLVDSDVDEVIARVVEKLSSNHDAILRD